MADVPWPGTEDNESDPNKGDLWLAIWEQARALVYILDTTNTSVDVAAATSPDTGDEYTVIVPADASPFPDAGIHIWAQCRGTLPRRALAHRLGNAPAWVPHVLAAGDAPTGAFPPINDPLDPRAERRAELTDTLDLLAASSWLPVADVRLRDLVVGIRPGRLAQVTGLEPGDADQVLEGRRSLTDAQVLAVAEAYDLDIAEVARAARPRVADNIAKLFDDPTRLRAVRRRAVEARKTEPEVMIDIALPVIQHAARTTGHAEPDWGALIDDALSD
jgi:hypothetical protein